MADAVSMGNNQTDFEPCAYGISTRLNGGDDCRDLMTICHANGVSTVESQQMKSNFAPTWKFYPNGNLVHSFLPQVAMIELVWRCAAQGGVTAHSG